MSMTRNLDKFGSVGLLITMLLSPCCFPIIAFGAAALGLGTFEIFGEWTMWIFQAMFVVSLIGLYFSFFSHRCMYPLLLAIASTLLVIYGYHFSSSEYWIYLLYLGAAGMLAATIWNYQRNRLHGCCIRESEEPEVELRSTITCPECGHQKEEIMPTNACAYFYECDKCRRRLKPLKGDCCVFCSYGTVKCPPMQAGNSCCE